AGRDHDVPAGAQRLVAVGRYAVGGELERIAVGVVVGIRDLGVGALVGDQAGDRVDRVGGAADRIDGVARTAGRVVLQVGREIQSVKGRTRGGFGADHHVVGGGAARDE